MEQNSNKSSSLTYTEQCDKNVCDTLSYIRYSYIEADELSDLSSLIDDIEHLRQVVNHYIGALRQIERSPNEGINRYNINARTRINGFIERLQLAKAATGKSRSELGQDLKDELSDTCKVVGSMVLAYRQGKV